MARPDLAQIVSTYEADFRQLYGLSAHHSKVLGSIKACRTARLGGHAEVCDSCGVTRVWYNSCRDRHCPKCQSLGREDWLTARRAELLPVKHFHLVFTIPAVLHDVFRYNERNCYDALFRTAWSSLKTLCAQDKYMGALPGMLAVLHTWGQNLHYHPHVHALVPAGGLRFDRCGWQPSKHKGYLVAVRALSRLFRGRLVSQLRAAYRAGDLVIPPNVSLKVVLSKAMSQEWVVYAKPPFGKATKLLDYLGRYLKRVAISNDRLLKSENGQVQFTYRDYSDGSKRKVMTLSGVEFLRRFVQHILPAGYCKVRYYGILANRHRHRTLTLCHYLLGKWYEPAPKPDRKADSSVGQTQCPHCEGGYWIKVALSGGPSRAPPSVGKGATLI